MICCVICGCDIKTAPMCYGAGNGTGQVFECSDCVDWAAIEICFGLDHPNELIHGRQVSLLARSALMDTYKTGRGWTVYP